MRIVLLGVLAIGILFGMYMFFASEQAENEAKEEATNANASDGPVRITLAPEQYSFDFSGADSIVVQYEDFSTGSRQELDERIITDPKVIDRIKNILETLPKEGQLQKELSLGLVTTITAFKEGQPFAYVAFYRTMLQAEDATFYGSEDQTVGQLESELYSIVAELRSR